MINYSIIIPHYNIPALLGRCLRSIPQRDDVQVIVVDDNSPDCDDYVNTIPELSRPNVEFYISRDRKGAGHVRNIGLEHAKGKWLIFADSDDFFVENFNVFLDEYVNCCEDIIYFNIRSCDSNNTDNIRISKNKERLFSRYLDTKNELIFRVGYTEPWGKFIKRKLIVDRNISFQETKGHNDLLFSVMSGVYANNIKIVDKPLYWYVYREGSLGHQAGIEPIDKIKDRIFAYNETEKFLRSNGILTRTYLPSIPCIRVLRKDFSMLNTLLKVAGDLGCSRTRIVINIFRYYIRLFFCLYGMGLDEQLVL